MKPIRDVSEAAQALESTLLRQMLRDSGAFSGNGGPGSQIHAEMFVDALANAVEAAGGVGLARLVEESLSPEKDGMETTDATHRAIEGDPTDSLNVERKRAELLFMRSRPGPAKGDWP